MSVCKKALDLNGRLIDSDQLEYQESLRLNFREMVERLAEIFGESVSSQCDSNGCSLETIHSAVSSPLDRSKRFTLFLPWQTCSF